MDMQYIYDVCGHLQCICIPFEIFGYWVSSVALIYAIDFIEFLALYSIYLIAYIISCPPNAMIN